LSSSGTYNFSVSNGEVVLAAYERIKIFAPSIRVEHMMTARRELNFLLAEAANKQVNLWKVDKVSVPLINGQAEYAVDPKTVMILDGWITTGVSSPSDANDIYIVPISRTEYASYPNKAQQGFPTSYWYDRLVSPTITLWPVPDGSSATILKYYRVRQVQDANLQNGQTVEIPYRWLEAFADGLAYRLARIWSPQMAAGLKQVADESYQIAAAQDVESVNTYISPMIGSYFR